MTAGLPGIGIGGVFYLLCAVFMPLKELWNTVRGKTSRQRWFMVATQIGLLCGIMLGFWLTGLLLGIVLTKTSLATFRQGGPAQIANLFHLKPMYVSLLTLMAVWFAIRIINFVLDNRSPVKAR